jgi:NAD+ kinase
VNYLLIYNPRLPQTEAKARAVAGSLERLGARAAALPAEYRADIAPDIRAIIAFGGDGTIIRIAKLYAEREIPVLGINMGTIGFLSNLDADELAGYLPRLLRGDYSLDRRMMLNADIIEKDGAPALRCLALNEICVKTPGAHMVRIGIEIGGNFHGWYKGDGLLVSTPTGSTAYALAAGGPVIDPALEVILLTPMLSYQLSKRPLVIAGDKPIRLSCEQEVFVSCDGQTDCLARAGAELLFCRAEVRFPLINLKGRDFFASVDKRLGQNAAP